MRAAYIHGNSNPIKKTMSISTRYSMSHEARVLQGNAQNRARESSAVLTSCQTMIEDTHSGMDTRQKIHRKRYCHPDYELGDGGELTFNVIHNNP
jgi:hypothetical protein